MGEKLRELDLFVGAGGFHGNLPMEVDDDFAGVAAKEILAVEQELTAEVERGDPQWYAYRGNLASLWRVACA